VPDRDDVRLLASSRPDFSRRDTISRTTILTQLAESTAHSGQWLTLSKRPEIVLIE
jgi:hypothetical protein